ncbi:uncharacterized protein isoform X2 [Leptinotarsa decemlineata]|uniref:uncharacterized protein isoform X2 n=1 Tax=Leptinotarsa decemlineata TaxID=7539 RepID=UPI003D307F24
MNHRLAFVIAIFFFCGVDCVDIKKVESIISQRVENDTEAASTEFPTGKGRSSRMIYAELVSCAVRYDTSCLVDVAEDYLEVQRQELLAQADAQVSASGRANPDNSPSHLAKTIEKLLSELAGMFKSGISSFFREAADDDEIDDADNNSIDNENKDDEKNSRDVVESRVFLDKKKRKKKGGIKKLFRLVRVGILAGVVIMKIALLIKIFEAALKFKLLLVGVTSLILQIVKFWMDFKEKRNAHHDEGIVYKNPYDGGLSGAEWAGPGSPGGEYHARSAPSAQNYAQNLAYSQYTRK